MGIGIIPKTGERLLYTEFGPATQVHRAGEQAPLPLTQTPDDDMLSAVYLLLLKQREENLQRGESRISGEQLKKAATLLEKKEAIARVREAEGEDSPGFWDCVGNFFEDLSQNLIEFRLDHLVSDSVDNVETAINSSNFWRDLEGAAAKVAKVAAVLASVAATAATFGTAAPLIVGVAIALSAGGFAVAQTKCLDGLLGQGASQWVGGGMQLASVAVSAGAASLAAGEAWLNLSTGGTQVLANGGRVAAALGGSAAVVAAVAHGRNGDFESRAEHCRADAKSKAYELAHINREIELVTLGLRECHESSRRVTEYLHGAISIKHQSQLSTSALRG